LPFIAIAKNGNVDNLISKKIKKPCQRFVLNFKNIEIHFEFRRQGFTESLPYFLPPSD